MKVATFTLCLFMTLLGYSQNGFHDGFIVMQNSDTIHGLVKDRKVSRTPEIYEKIRFKENGKGVAKKYSAQKIKSYSINNQVFESFKEKSLHGNKLFLSQSSDYIFLKVIKKGKASHYQLEWVEQESGVIEVIDYIKREDQNYSVRSTQGVLGLKKKLLAEYFKDCEPLVRKIKTKEIKTTDQIILFYNNYWIIESTCSD